MAWRNKRGTGGDATLKGNITIENDVITDGSISSNNFSKNIVRLTYGMDNFTLIVIAAENPPASYGWLNNCLKLGIPQWNYPMIWILMRNPHSTMRIPYQQVRIPYSAFSTDVVVAKVRMPILAWWACPLMSTHKNGHVNFFHTTSEHSNLLFPRMASFDPHTSSGIKTLFTPLEDVRISLIITSCMKENSLLKNVDISGANVFRLANPGNNSPLRNLPAQKKT